jgi:hypothetical protein
MLSRTLHAPLPLLLTLGLLTLGPVACDKDKPTDEVKSDGAEPSKKSDAPTGDKAGDEALAEAPSGDEAPSEAAPEIDDEIKADLAAILAECEVNVSGCTVTKCKNDEKKTLTDKFELRGGKRAKDRGAVIDTFAAALADPSPELQTVAANVMGSAFRSMPDVESVNPAAARRLIEAWSKLPRYQANQSITGVVHAAMLSGDDEVAAALYQAVEAHPEANKASAYEALLAHGRLRAFPKVQELSKSDDDKIVVAALTSWRNMYSATDEEKAQICPWITSFLGDPRVDVFEAAGYGAVRCRGEVLDKLLDEGERRLSESHEFTRKHYFVFRDVCFSFMGEKTAGEQAQCDRNYAFLQKVVDDGEVDSDMRGLALDAIYYQRRDATTKALATKYLKHKDEKVAARAKEIVDKLADK